MQFLLLRHGLLYRHGITFPDCGPSQKLWERPLFNCVSGGETSQGRNPTFAAVSMCLADIGNVSTWWSKSLTLGGGCVSNDRDVFSP